jgi:hypothetical protein
MNRWLLSPALVRLAARSVLCSSILAKSILRLALLISNTPPQLGSRSKLDFVLAPIIASYRVTTSSTS